MMMGHLMAFFYYSFMPYEELSLLFQFLLFAFYFLETCLHCLSRMIP